MKHPNKDLNRVLEEAYEQAWSVERGKKYIKLSCHCGTSGHIKWVHLSPSDPHYERNLRAWLKRNTCWEEKTR